ncbi:MAG: T9SS type A sorting domain-containing protein [Bacteroidota bacterium]
MKYLCTLLLLCGIMASNFTHAQVTFSESFESFCPNESDALAGSCFPGWIAPSGTPDIYIFPSIPAYDGSRYLNMAPFYRDQNFCDNPSGALLGETAAFNFDFEAGKTYRISYAMRGEAQRWEWMLLPQALPAINSTDPCSTSYLLPDVPNDALVLDGGAPPGAFLINDWVEVEQTITLTQDYEQLWFRSSNNTPTPAGTVFFFSFVHLDLVEIEVIEGCEFSAPKLRDCQYDMATGEGSLHWKPVPGALGYEVEINIGDPACGCPFGNFSFSDNTPTSSYTIPGSFAAKCFSYTVRAICPDGLMSPAATACYDGGAGCVEPPCETTVGFYLPTEACFGDPIHFVNQSTNYDNYLITVCIAGPNQGCNGRWVTSQWQNNDLGALELGQAYNDWSGTSEWELWCGSGALTYRVTLAVQSECENWLAETQFITINCPPCPENQSHTHLPYQTGQERNSASAPAGFEPTGVASVLPTVEVFPNPFHSETQLRFELPEAAAIRLELYAMDGSLLRHEESYREAGSQSWRIPDTWLPRQGLYTFVIKVKNEVIVGKMLKVK